MHDPEDLGLELYIQDPIDPQALTLHEKILELCEGAIRGAGAFAFVTRAGAELLLGDKVFKKFAARASFDLIVGVDEVTNVSALDALREASNGLSGLTVRAFYHNRSQSVFHPKFCWFRHRSKAFLLVGSGNLTARALRGNWEAFAVDELAARIANELEAQWAQWVKLHASRLRPLDDTEVLARARLNVLQRRPGAAVPAPPVPAEPPLTQDVLVAEIPGATNLRWNQANFDLNTFRNFFGAQPGIVRRVVLQHVNSSGGLERLEPRPSVSVRSQNFRFELAAAAGLAYPNTGRPIAVFVRIAPRAFRYRLLMPGDSQHAILTAFLDTMWRGRSDRMRRVITNTDEMRQAWPNSPLWRMALEVQD